MLATRGPEHRAVSGTGAQDTSAQWESSWQREEAANEDIAMVEADVPIHGNVIEFPRELVAPRKARPRLIEGPQGAYESDAQLSIFEVHPGSISTAPEQAAPVAEPAGRARTEWSDIQLDAEAPPQGSAETAAAERPAAQRTLQTAPFSRRLLAGVVDASLIAGAFVIAALLSELNAPALPSAREAELGSSAALLALAALYQAVFFTLGRATPGMRYANVSLRTFDGRTPGRTRRCGRLMAMALSLLPVGLGMVWALFDEEHLSWHDRLSGTYLRWG
jgi:uncharacterized RDD family membrane protein YckC